MVYILLVTFCILNLSLDRNIILLCVHLYGNQKQTKNIWSLTILMICKYPISIAAHNIHTSSSTRPSSTSYTSSIYITRCSICKWTHHYQSSHQSGPALNDYQYYYLIIWFSNRVRKLLSYVYKIYYWDTSILYTSSKWEDNNISDWENLQS